MFSIGVDAVNCVYVEEGGLRGLINDFSSRVVVFERGNGIGVGYYGST